VDEQIASERKMGIAMVHDCINNIADPKMSKKYFRL